MLGWGRSFTSRPKALKGYVRYVPVAVTSESKNYAELKKGDLDNGKIYIALLDNTQKEYSGKQYPVIVNTADTNSFFKNTDANVIAYGELVFDKATDGDGMVEFNIPLDYYRTDIKPSNIMIVCAASKGGDYFVGGDGSVMYLDDFELVY